MRKRIFIFVIMFASIVSFVYAENISSNTTTNDNLKINNDLIVKYKEIFIAKIGAKLDKLSGKKLDEILIKIDNVINKLYDNKKISNIKKDRLIAQYEALRLIIIEKKENFYNNEKNKLRITNELKGKVFCYEDKLLITWEAPKDLELARILLKGPDTLGIVKYVNPIQKVESNVGKGEYEWNFYSEDNGYIFKPGNLYKLVIDATYNGESISYTTDGYFEIKENCGN